MGGESVVITTVDYERRSSSSHRAIHGQDQSAPITCLLSTSPTTTQLVEHTFSRRKFSIAHDAAWLLIDFKSVIFNRIGARVRHKTNCTKTQDIPQGSLFGCILNTGKGGCVDLRRRYSIIPVVHIVAEPYSCFPIVG